MKVLVTGCSSAQTSESVAGKNPTFTGLLVQSLRESGHDVVWDTPTMRWNEEHLSQYDSVVVGLTAPTSITAYRLYGALSVIDKASKVTNVKYLVDAPEPHRLWNGIRAVVQNPDDLVKDFYSRRSEFSEAIIPENKKRLQSVIERLYQEPWEDTIVPAFPWFRTHHVTNHIPNISADKLHPLCLDSVVLKNLGGTGLYMKSNPSGWFYDSKSKWLSKIEKTVDQGLNNFDKSGSAGIMADMNLSTGSFISVHKNDEPWWSVNLIQSLYVGTPVVTDWRHTSYLGDSWNVLAHSIEDMTDSERTSLVISQKKSYLSAVSSYEEALTQASTAVFNK